MCSFRMLSLSLMVVYLMTGCTPGREAGCSNIAVANIEQSYKCLVGLTVKTALARLQIDTSAVRTFEEPTFLIRGLEITQGDSLVIKLYTGRTRNFPSGEKKVHGSDLPLILDKKVIGASWRKPKVNRRAFTGKVIIYYENR